MGHGLLSYHRALIWAVGCMAIHASGGSLESGIAGTGGTNGTRLCPTFFFVLGVVRFTRGASGSLPNSNSARIRPRRLVDGIHRAMRIAPGLLPLMREMVVLTNLDGMPVFSEIAAEVIGPCCFRTANMAHTRSDRMPRM